MLDISKLRRFENERFYSVLDVALDIQGEVDFGANQIVIPRMRHLVRYSILLPAATPSMMNRYCDLRWKALKFLESEGYIDEVESSHGYWEDHWEGSVQVRICNQDEFCKLAVLLAEEEERRDPCNSGHLDIASAMSRVEQLCDRFHPAALKLQVRRASRTSLNIADEYDLQYLLGVLLETRFSDIRREEATPSYAGKPARLDFLLKYESVVVETKMIRDGLTDSKVGDELMVDIGRYKVHPDCKALFCFVYDPKHKLINPAALESDLSRKHDDLIVRVRVRPKR